jgi:SNF2 family DNA or RNA helicase
MEPNAMLEEAWRIKDQWTREAGLEHSRALVLCLSPTALGSDWVGLAWLRDSLEDIAAEGDKVLVFSQYTDKQFAGADWIEKELADFGALNYSKDASERQRKALLAALKEKPEHKVFIGHPKTAGLGLNELVVANYVVHFDHWWNPAVLNQATARAHRPGKQRLFSPTTCGFRTLTRKSSSIFWSGSRGFTTKSWTA